VIDLKECPRCGDELQPAEPEVGIMSAGCASCRWYEGCEADEDLVEAEAREDDQADRDAADEDDRNEPQLSYGEEIGDYGNAGRSVWPR
jgi:hypothetical protein